LTCSINSSLTFRVFTSVAIPANCVFSAKIKFFVKKEVQFKKNQQ